MAVTIMFVVQAAALQLLAGLSTCTVRPVLALTNKHTLTSLPSGVWVCTYMDWGGFVSAQFSVAEEKEPHMKNEEVI